MYYDVHLTTVGRKQGRKTKHSQVRYGPRRLEICIINAGKCLIQTIYKWHHSNLSSAPDCAAVMGGPIIRAFTAIEVYARQRQTHVLTTVMRRLCALFSGVLVHGPIAVPMYKTRSNQQRHDVDLSETYQTIDGFGFGSGLPGRQSNNGHIGQDEAAPAARPAVQRPVRRGLHHHPHRRRGEDGGI